MIVKITKQKVILKHAKNALLVYALNIVCNLFEISNIIFFYQPAE